MTISHKSSRGVASIIITIILSVVVVGMIAGLTLLSNQEGRQSSNTDQSNRALNGAQTYTQALADKVANNPSYNMKECNNDGSLAGPQPEIPISGTQDVAVTCATVTNQGDTLDGQIKQDKTVQADLQVAPTSTNGPVQKLRINWGLKGTDKDEALGLPNPLYPISNNYPKSPATIELTFIWYGDVSQPGKFNGTDFGSGSLPMKTVAVSPNTSGVNFKGITANCSSTPAAAMKNYLCGMPNAVGTSWVDLPSIGVPASTQNVVVRMTARYASTSYSMSFANAAGDPVDVIFPHAVIDVTARSGQTYRRIQATKPIKYTTFDFISNVLYSGKNLCKTLKVYSNHEGAPSGDANAGRNDPACEGS